MAGGRRRIDLDCGIAYGRIASWLDDELALPCEGGCWLFEVAGAACSVSLEPLEPRTLGAVSLERSHLVADGAPGAVDEFERLFTLRFMSAGG